MMLIPSPVVAARLLVRVLGGPGSGRYPKGSGAGSGNNDPAMMGKTTVAKEIQSSIGQVNNSGEVEAVHFKKPDRALVAVHSENFSQWTEWEQRFRMTNRGHVEWNMMPSVEHFFKVEDYYDGLGIPIKSQSVFASVNPNLPKGPIDLKSVRDYWMARGVTTLGGPGSGNFGHSGRPGAVGGSGGGGLSVGMPEEGDFTDESDSNIPRQDEIDALTDVLMEASNAEDYDIDALAEAPIRMRKEMKAEIVETLADRLQSSMPELSSDESQKIVQTYVKAWTMSTLNSPTGVELQHAVVQEFDLKNAATDHYPNFKSEVTPYARAFVRAEYEEAQDFFNDNDIKNITVFRGIGGNSVKERGEQTINLQPASSWTTDLDIAKSFAKMQSKGNAEDVESKILVARIPVKRVQSTAVTGRGALHESEVIIHGGPLKVKAYGSKQYFDILKSIQ